MLDKVDYTVWQKRIRVEVCDVYDYYIVINGKRVGFPCDKKTAMLLAGWLPSAMEDIKGLLNGD